MATSIIFSAIGIIAIVSLFLRFNRFIYLYTRSSSLSQYHYGQEPWALVTGASDGIGKCIATELARNNFNVVLHGRNPTKLENVVSSLRQQFPKRNFRTAVLDASSASHQQISNLVSSLGDIHLTILVNNVAGGQVVQPLTNTTPDQVDLSLNCNARFPAQLTRSLLSRFAASKDRSLILNIGSAANTFAPYASVYGGSKACNQAMSSCLNVEMVAENLASKIEILCVSVGLVTEAANNTMPPSLCIPTASTMAQAILARVGCGRAVVVGYFWHAVQLAVLGSMPISVTTGIVAPIMRQRWEEEKRKM
ncbi:MAG: hypothetical protein Q9169_006989 [Polycauliona sp. 2 TL-2023]